MRFPTLTHQLLALAAVLAALPSQATVTQTIKREFDQLNRLFKVIQADGSWVQYGYDPNGNRIYSFDQLGRITRYEYDAFNRLVATTNPDGKVTKFAYNGRGNLVKVTDPRGLTTEYQYNGFGELINQISPDTGASTQTRDAVDGRVTSHTNAAGQTTQFKYDQFGRLIEQRHAGGPNWTFQRDNLGRLIEVTDAAGTTRYVYDSQSRLQSKTQEIGTLTQTVSYRWNAANQLASITTPSGRVIDYTRDKGQIVAINLDGQPLLSQVVYQPLGVQGWTWANGLHHTRLYDTNGRLYRFESAGVIAKRLIFDGAGNVQKLEDLQNATGTQAFGYDRLDQLTTEKREGRSDVYQYDAAGNRLSVNENGTETVSRIDPASNRLMVLGSQVRTYTATGHLQSDGTRSFEYDGAERLVKVTTNGQAYQYQHNVWGQRLVKPGVRFVYDEQGRLLGEYRSDGGLIQETVWLGNLPIATIRPDTKNINRTLAYYVHPDHLGAPRAVSDPAINKVVWQWDSDAFGESHPAEDADRDNETFIFNLRFPGQYFDSETKLHYNYHRNYDPQTGRYIQSDPIGLGGGINTFIYALDNPISKFDRDGLTTLTFNVEKGVLTVDPEVPGRKPYNIDATSGKEECENKTDCERKQDKGPLPRGKYEIYPKEIDDPSLMDDLRRNFRTERAQGGGDWGDWRARIYPLPGTKRYGRTGFYLHGGYWDGSAGCIDFGGGVFGNNKLLKDLQNDPNNRVPLIVQ